MNATDPKLVFDFEEDIRSLYASKLEALGVPVKPADTASNLIVRYFSVPNRRIPRFTRNVIWSPELKTQLAQLSTDYQHALAKIEEIARAGDDLDPYQSRDIARQPWKSDPQLLEWGITHFHLGLAPDARHSQMVAGTADLLFVVVRPDTLYFVDVMPHASFSKQRLFDVANKSWPHLFGHARLAGVVGLEYEPTDEERKALRAAGINVPTLGADGHVYGAVQGGVTTSGASLAVVQQYVIPRTGPMRHWQILCEKDPARVVAMIPAAQREGLPAIDLHASENPAGEIVITATNAVGGPLVLGAGYPPR